MPASSITERTKWVLLVPFAYAFFSRMGLRGFLFNAATLWGAGLLLTIGLNTEIAMDPARWVGGAARYFAGYLVFIAIYEIGYLVNDTWGTRHDATPRKRMAVSFGATFFALFIAIRLALAWWLAAALGVLAAPWFWTLIGALVAVIVLHNTLRREEFKLISFAQMSLLRFATPVIIALGAQKALLVLAIGALLFTFQRFLTYQDSKGRLSLPERKRAEFPLLTHLCAFPVIALLALVSGEPVVWLVWAYYLAFTGAILLLQGNTAVRNLREGKSGNSQVSDH